MVAFGKNDRKHHAQRKGEDVAKKRRQAEIDALKTGAAERGVAKAVATDAVKSLFGFQQGGPVYAQMGMQMPDYSIQGVPQLQQRQGPLGALMDFGKGKALSYGLDMMFPGSGIAREAAGAVAPTIFNRGGAVYRAPGGGVADWWGGLGGDAQSQWADAAQRVIDYGDEEEFDMVGPDVYGLTEHYGGDSYEAYQNIANDILAAQAAGAAAAEAPAEAPKKEKKAAPKPKPRREMPKDMGGVDWNVGLGRVGDWDLSTEGSYTLRDKGKDPYNVKLKGRRDFDVNRLFGAAPLGGPKERSKYADYKGGEYKERMPGERITTDVARGRKTNPLQPYLDAGISADQAQMLLANKVPPPVRRAKGGPIGMSSGMSPDVGMKGPIAGMTPGPLGMSDMLAAGKGKDISKVTYKKTGGKVTQQVDIAYHAPLAAKPSA